MKNFLITGVSGFIGRALAVSAVARNYSVWGVGSEAGFGNMPAGLAGESTFRLPNDDLQRVVEEFQPDVIFHCAGSALPAQSIQSPTHDFQCSVPVVQHLLEVARQVAPKVHIVVLSSAAVYGQATDLPITEEVIPAPVSPYGFHKWVGEILCREYAEIYGLRVSSARIFSAYGPNLTKQVIWDSINKLDRPRIAEFSGTGDESRDFVFIDDLVEALFHVAARPGGGHEVINVASAVETKISEVVATVARQMGVSNHRWKFTGKQVPGAAVHWRADISKLQSLGFVPSTSLDEGIKRTLAWYQNL